MATIQDPLVVSRYIAAILERVEVDGLVIDAYTDFQALQRMCESLSGKASVSAPFSPDFFDIGPADGLWLCCRDAKDRVVHVQAMRRETLEGIDLATHWCQQLRRLYSDRSAAVRFVERFCPAAQDITGVVVYHGEVWITPRMRRRRLAGLLSRLALALALLKWTPDYVYGFNDESVALSGLTAREGYMHMQPHPVEWERPPDHINPSEWLVWMGRRDLEYLVRQPVE